MSGRGSPVLFTVLCFGVAFLYIPMVVLIAYSFNASPLVSVWGGFSTRWYAELFHNRQILDAAELSLEIAVLASTGAVVLGTLAAIAMVRFQIFRGRFLLSGMITAPLVMPDIITGITQLLLFVSMTEIIGWPATRGFLTVVIAHVTFCMAYVTVTMQARLQTVDRALEEAAMDLGSGPVEAFVTVTLPIVLPAIVSAWTLCVTLSLDDLVISSFVTGPGATTLPMVIYSKVKLGVSPDMNALASLIIAVAGAAVLTTNVLLRRHERRRMLAMQTAARPAA